MKNLSLENIVAAVHGEYRGEAGLLGRSVSAVCTDSRAAEAGCLFAAIRGARVDGHDYIPAAFARGALCALAEEAPDTAAGPVILVPSTEAALRALAEFYRAQMELTVLGVTGSVGKTTTKEMCAAVLSRRFCTLKTQGNFNNELGVPLTLFRLREAHQVAVVEMGVSDFGEMRRLTAMARPDMAVYTAIGHSHLEQFGDLPGVLRAKGELLEGMPEDGLVFVNGDDGLLRAWDTGVRKKLLFGTTPDCDVYARGLENQGIEGLGCEIVAGTRRIAVNIPAFGMHLVYAALAAAAVGLHMGLTDEEIAQGIAAYTPVGSRSRTIDTGFCTIVDDCYNANPSSVASALASLGSLDARRVCILGDMLELGENTQALHRAVGRLTAEAGVSLLLACGELAQAFYAGAREAENPPMAWYFPDKESLFDALPRLIQKGDAVLVKASHSMHFADIVAELEKLQ